MFQAAEAAWLSAILTQKRSKEYQGNAEDSCTTGLKVFASSFRGANVKNMERDFIEKFNS